MVVLQYSISADQLDSAGRFSTRARASRWAAASTTFSSQITAWPTPGGSRSRAGSAEITPLKSPNRSSSRLANGLTSRRGMARNSTSSSIS